MAGTKERIVNSSAAEGRAADRADPRPADEPAVHGFRPGRSCQGSFYWHFKDREELITEALAAWERDATDLLIEQLQEVDDSVERLSPAYGRGDRARGREHPDVRLLPSASDPVVGEVVKRVQRERLDFLAQVFRDAGFTPAESRLRARLAYSLYLGWFQQRLIECSERTTTSGRAA